MKIAILGGTGLLGTALMDYCILNKIDFLEINHSECDVLTEKEKLFNILDANKPDVIINTIAVVGVDSCEKEPVVAYKINSLFPYQLAEYSNKKNIRLIHISTAEVFDGSKKKPYFESDIPNPLNIYGGTKLLGENLVKNNCNNFNIIRLPALFGKRRNNKSSYSDKVYPWLDSDKKLKITDDKIDSPTYSLDVAKVIFQEVIPKHINEIIHISNYGETSLYDFVLEMGSIYGKKLNFDRAKSSDFPTIAKKTMYACLTSNKIYRLREWKSALKEFEQTKMKEI
jgi:dTDP-4-dehydrorhamnose reductase